MEWLLRCRDILDSTADVLVCSANVYLNLSGGVGGAYSLKYGTSLQDELRSYLSSRSLVHVERGDAVPTSACGGPYQLILHAVAVDGFYHSSPEIIRKIVEQCLVLAANINAKTITLPALATGYGNLTMREFAEGIVPLIGKTFGTLCRPKSPLPHSTPPMNFVNSSSF